MRGDDGYRLPGRIPWNGGPGRWEPHYTAGFVVMMAGVLLTWLIGGFCGGDESPAAAPAASLSPAPAGTSPAPSPPNEPSAYSPETQTGIASVDSLIAAVTGEDTAAIMARLAYIDVLCTDSSNPIPGPGCPAGVAPGTLIQAFSRSGCEFTFEPAAHIGPVVEGMVLPGLRLFAVYRVEPPAAPGPVPAGEYGVVFVGEFPGRPPAGPGLFVATIDGEGHIVHWSSACGVVDPYTYPAEAPYPIAEYILPPQR